jgi:hypothetical protein
MRSYKTRTLSALVAAGLLGLAGSALAADPVRPNALQPCVNGEVSASGLYPSQAVEDAVLAAGVSALEPALNGEVSSDGLYPSEAMRRQALGI